MNHLFDPFLQVQVVWVGDVVLAAKWIGAGTASGPGRYHKEMFWKAPGFAWRKHVVLQNKVLRIRPVVRNFACIMPANNIRRNAFVLAYFRFNGLTCFR